MIAFGIDVSPSMIEGGFDLARAGREGVQFAIMEAQGAIEAPCEAVRAAGIKVGAYFHGQAQNAAEGRAEAEKCLAALGGAVLDYPVYYAITGMGGSAEAVGAFCKRVESAGYIAGIRASEAMLTAFAADADLTGYARCVTRYSMSRPAIKAGMWQYGGRLNYIRGNRVAGVVCCQNYCYTDYSGAAAEARARAAEAKAEAEAAQKEPAQKKPPKRKPRRQEAEAD